MKAKVSRSVPAGFLKKLARWWWTPYLVLVLAPFAGHLASFVTGLSDNPIGLYSGLASGSGGLLPGSPFNDSNIGWTNQALGHLAAQDWLHGIVPWWNPYSGIGLPLAGEMQPAALFLPFVLLLGFQSGILWLMGVLQALSGVACFMLFRRIGLRRWTALIGGILFEFSGTFATVPGETILNVVPFLPLLLLGIEHARDRDGACASLLFVGIGIGWSLLGGFPETALIDGLFALVWMAARLPGAERRGAYIGRIVMGGCIGLLIASPAIVSFIDFAATSGAFGNHQAGWVWLDIYGLASIVLPFVFGLSGDIQGNLHLLTFAIGTAGYVMLMLLPFAFAGLIDGRFKRLACTLGLWIGLAMAKIFGFAPVETVFRLLPVAKEVNFTYYSSPTWELAAITLGMFGLEAFAAGRRLRGPMVATVAAFAGAIGLAWPWRDVYHWDPGQFAIMMQRLDAAAGFAACGLILLGLARRCLPPGWQRFGYGLALVGNALVLFALPQFAGTRGWRIDRPALRYLKDHLGLDRFYTVGPIEPNYGAYFDLASINEMYVPLASLWADYVDKALLPAAGAEDGQIFWPPFAPMTVHNAMQQVVARASAYRAIGVRYIVTQPGARFQPSLMLPRGLTDYVGLPLYPGDRLLMSAKGPPAIGRFSPVTDLAVTIATYGGAANGNLVLTLCADGLCGRGSRDLKTATENAPAWVRLNRAVPLHAGEAYTVTIAHQGGDRPNVIWLPRLRGGAVSLTSTSKQDVAGRTPQVLYASGPAPGGLTPAYADKTMEIWRLAGALPYYRTTGSACSLSGMRRQRVLADCRGPATLVRQELFMPGWQAWVNGRQVPIARFERLMQTIDLPAGRDRVRFRFAPPYIALAWIAFWLGVSAMVAAIVVLLSRNGKVRGVSFDEP